MNDFDHLFRDFRNTLLIHFQKFVYNQSLVVWMW